MLNAISEHDFVVAEPFRWRAILYKPGSALPPGMPQGAINQFLHRDPPLVKLKAAKAASSNGNGTAKKAPRKKAKKKASKKKTARA